MKASVKVKTARAPKRDLFAELSEGMTALALARQRKRTLRTHAVEFMPAHGVGQDAPGRVTGELDAPR